MKKKEQQPCEKVEPLGELLQDRQFLEDLNNPSDEKAYDEAWRVFQPSCEAWLRNVLRKYVFDQVQLEKYAADAFDQIVRLRGTWIPNLISGNYKFRQSLTLFKELSWHTTKRYREALKYYRKMDAKHALPFLNAASLNQPIAGTEDLSLAATVADQRLPPNPTDADLVAFMLSRLDEQERRIVMLKDGLDDSWDTERTFVEIAAELDRSAYTVRMIYWRARNRMVLALIREGLIDQERSPLEPEKGL